MRAGILAACAALILFTGACATSCVKTGHVGVVTRFGKVTGTALPEGVNLVSPLNLVHDMSVQTQEMKETMDAPSSEGLIFRIEASLLYHLQPASATTVYQSIGETYRETLIEPTFRSALRDITAGHKASDMYSSARDQVQGEIQAKVAAPLLARGIAVEQVLLRDLQLPPTLKASIEEKQQAEQQSQKMQFTITKERQEAERKRIEAQGIADFQKIVTEGISEKLLEWKGIEATLDLAKSPNTKVVVVGAGKNGLPLILGQ